MKKIILAIVLVTIFADFGTAQVRTDGNPAVGVVSGDLQFVNNFDFFALDVNGKGTLTIKTDPAYVGNIGVFAKVTPGDSVSYTILNGYRQFDGLVYGSISNFGTYTFNVSGYFSVRVQANSLPGPQTLHYTIIPEAPNKDSAVNILGVSITGTALNVNASGRVDITMDNFSPSMGPGVTDFRTQKVVLPTDQSAIPINCLSGCGSPPATPDTAAFTAGSTNVSISAGVYDDTLAALSAGISGAFRLTPNRAIHVNLRDNSGTELTSLTVKQPTGTNLHIVCDSGCGSPTAFADNSAFTFATTGITNIGAVVDDVATNSVTENSSGNPRMSGSRILYGNLRNSTGTEVVTTTTTPSAANLGLVVRNIPSGVQPISGSISISGTPNVNAITSTFGTSNISANGDVFNDGVVTYSTLKFNWTGTTTAGTLTFRGAFDGATFFDHNCFYESPVSGLPRYVTSVNLATDSGGYIVCSLSALTDFKVVASGWGVGTVTVRRAYNSTGSLGTQVSYINNIVPVTGTFWQATQPVSGTVTANAGTNLNTSLLALDSTQTNRTAKAQVTDGTRDGTVKAASTLPLATDTALVITARDTVNVSVINSAVPTNVSQLNSNTISTNSGATDAGTQRVILATDQAALPVTGTFWPANAATNITQINATTVDANSGNKSAGTLRVVLATDQPALTNKLLVTPDSVALPANQSVNVNQIGGSAVSTAASGVQKVGIVGNANAAMDAANNAAAPANVLVTGVETIAIGSQPTAATAANVRRQLATTEGVIFTQEGSSNRFSCVVPSTATVTTQCQAAPGAGLRAYVTSMSMSNAAATAQTLDIVYGTGAACVTGTTAITHKIQFGTNATTTSPFFVSESFTTPLVPVAANAICVRPSAATAFGATITGFIAP